MPYSDPAKRKEFHKAYYQANKEHFIEEARKSKARQRRERPAEYMHQRAKGRAKKLGIEFNIEVSDIILNSHCPVLGIPLRYETGPLGSDSASLDRIDNSKGYVKGNVCVISQRANSLKRDANITEIKAILAYMESVL